tara:strand:- start:127 stop:402 length:276 start_codon:yes stop_codon:yes gene_type:complete
MLSGICGILVALVIMGSTTAETTTKFEFHDLGDTRGLIFDKTTGEMEYKEIRTEPLPNPTISLDQMDVELSWGSSEPGSSISNPFWIQERK